MPVSLPARRHELLELLTEDLAAALLALKDFLPENTDKHSQVLALRARLNDANKERFRNTLSPDDYQRRVDTIRADCFDLVNGLEAVDFELPAATGAASAKASAGKQGSVLYRVPQAMPLRKPTICTVRVAIDEDAILEDIVLDDAVRLRPRVEVSDMMRAELLDPEGAVFSIRPLSETEQLVREEGYTQWLFSVTPQVEGKHQILVKVSMMEYVANLGRYVPREVSVLETVTIVTETAVSDLEEDAPLKPTGEQFAIGPEVLTTRGMEHKPPQAPAAPAPSAAAKPSTIYVPPPQAVESPAPAARRQKSSVRAMAVFLILLVGGSSATWALTPPPTRAWWVTSLRDSPEAYADYKEKFKDDPRAKEKVETATFRIAEKTGTLTDLREYLSEYKDGRYYEQVVNRIEALEVEELKQIMQQPEARRILQFVRDYPESERLQELKQAIGQRTDLLPVLERAYLNSIQAQPTRTKVSAYLKDFPESQSLPEVAAAAKTKVEVLRAVQPELEDAFLKKMETAPTAAQAETFLQYFPVPVQREKFEQILEKKPALKKRFLQKINQAEAEQKIREAAEAKRREQEALEKKRLAEMQRLAREETDATERARLEKEAAAEAERLHLKQEEAAAEQKRQEEEARRDTDGDGIPDKADQCPNEKGDVANNGCPTIDLPAGRKSGLEMVPVQGGTFIMGCQKGRNKDCYDQEKPAHTVTLSGFQIGKYEVTQADWRAVMGDNPSIFKNCDDCPVEQVSWDDIQDFLKKLNARNPGKNYRLPTEAEWEYAARGGHKMPQDLTLMSVYVGGNDIDKVAWYQSNSGRKTHPVGQNTHNELGLYDMSGNVAEWCSDWYGDYQEGAQTNPKGPKSGTLRVHRGGSWLGTAKYCRTTYRDHWSSGLHVGDLGFRLALSLQ